MHDVDTTLHSEVPAAPAADRQPPGIFEVFAQNQGSLRDFLARFTISRHEIEDVSQEAFLRAFRAERDKQVIAQPRAFLFRIARNLVLTHLSRRSRALTSYIEDLGGEDALGADDDLEAQMMAEQKLEIYCEAIASLPRQCRSALLMRKVYGLSPVEIARRMNLSVSTVEKHLVKGLRHCSRALAERYGEGELETGEAAVRRGAARVDR